MQDRHVSELKIALESIASAIRYLAFAVLMSGIYQMCGSMGHH